MHSSTIDPKQNFNNHLIDSLFITQTLHYSSDKLIKLIGICQTLKLH